MKIQIKIVLYVPTCRVRRGRAPGTQLACFSFGFHVHIINIIPLHTSAHTHTHTHTHTRLMNTTSYIHILYIIFTRNIVTDPWPLCGLRCKQRARQRFRRGSFYVCVCVCARVCEPVN